MRTKITRTKNSAAQKSRTKLLLFVLLAVIAVVFIPGRITGGMVDSRRYDASSMREETAALNDRASKATVARANKEAFANRRETVEAQLPSNPDLGGVIDAVSAALVRTGWTLVSGAPVQVAAGDDSNGLLTWNLDINANGRIESLPAMLEALTSLPRVLTISSVTLRQSETEVSASVSLSFYGYKSVG